MVAKLVALCMALFLVGGVAQAADPSLGSTTASIELVDAPTDLVVPNQPVVGLPLRRGVAIEMPPVVPLTLSVFAPRMDRPPRR